MLFWPILGTLCGFSAEAPYAARVAALQAAGVAVWDVLQSCVRPWAALDTAIERASEVPNDIAVAGARAGIRRICFNGGMAEAAFRRHKAGGGRCRGGLAEAAFDQPGQRLVVVRA